MATGLSLVGMGDAFAQKFIEKQEKIDKGRFLNILGYGGLVSGGVGHFWYKGLDALFGSKITLVSTLKKILVDQFLLTPPEIAIYMAWAHFGTGKQGSFVKKLKDDYWEILIVNYKLWIPTQCINFYLIPEKHRVLFQCIVMVIWATFLSYASHNSLSIEE